MSEKPTSRDFGSPIGMKVLAALIRLLPRRIVYWIAMIPVFWYYVTRSEGSLSSASYQRRLGMRGGPVRRFFFGLGQARAFSNVILDNMYLGQFGPKRFHMTTIGIENFRRVLERGQGLILLSAHVGNWHLGVNFLWDTRAHVHLVIDDVRQAEVKRQMDMAKKLSQHLTIHDVKKETNLIFDLKAALNRGEVVTLAGDRATGKRRTRLRFLGDEAWFPNTAYSLAAATGAPICTALTFRTGMQRYECYGIGPFCDEQSDKSTNATARTDEMIRQFVGHLETYVRRFPKQWFNFFDFWSNS
ncbi:MAG: lysophospholipid acyltransferase family protein [Proteobacteria bacterium]|nr:lysophospholipid acyltransferase family protein [Pseudomonadota bacterium]